MKTVIQSRIIYKKMGWLLTSKRSSPKFISNTKRIKQLLFISLLFTASGSRGVL